MSKLVSAFFGILMLIISPLIPIQVNFTAISRIYPQFATIISSLRVYTWTPLIHNIMTTPVTKDNNFLKAVFDFHRVMQKKRYILVYEGEVNQDIVKAFTSMAEHRLEKGQEGLKVKKRVFNVMVECLQNITRHSSDADDPTLGIGGKGIFVVGQEGTDYVVITGNAVENSKVEELKSLLDRVNELDAKGIKELYMKAIRESKISDRGGAGLGFIDIAKKTGSKLDYEFQPVDGETTFFLLKTTIKNS